MSNEKEFGAPDPIDLIGSEAEIARESARRTRRSFMVGGVAAATGYGLYRATQVGPVIGQQPITFRRTFQADASIMRSLFGERGLSPTYPLSQAENLRLNGTVGLEQEIKPSWLALCNSSAPPRVQKPPTLRPRRHRLELRVRRRHAVPTPRPPTSRALPATVPQASHPRSAAPAATPAPAPKSNTMNPTGAVDSDAGAALAARIEALTAGHGSKKPHEGEDEAGPSSSGLDRNTPGLLLTMDDLQQAPLHRTRHPVPLHRRLEPDRPLGWLPHGRFPRSLSSTKRSTVATPASSTWKRPTATTTAATT